MLVRIDCTDRNKSLYKCDKCGLEITNQTLWRITFNNKTYHLCKKHAIILKRWLNNVGK